MRDKSNKKQTWFRDRYCTKRFRVALVVLLLSISWYFLIPFTTFIYLRLFNRMDNAHMQVKINILAKFSVTQCSLRTMTVTHKAVYLPKYLHMIQTIYYYSVGFSNAVYCIIYICILVIIFTLNYFFYWSRFCSKNYIPTYETIFKCENVIYLIDFFL